MNDERQVNTYDPEEIRQNRKGMRIQGWKKGLIIFLIVAVIVVGLGAGCNYMTGKVLGSSQETYNFDDDYIGVLQIHGTIAEESSSNDTYNQKWLVKRVEEMTSDPLNKGLILSIDTPGGSVYATDELYLKIKEYAGTGRPVYTYMESMAASGGYYLAAASDKIFANRNSWTGSIGVTIGTVYDVSGFLEKMGIKTVTITSGKNKAMGSAVEPLTKEQKSIYQGLVDEAYEQFVGVVASGRKMDVNQVKKLADGRIYTAKQAEKNGLIDKVGSMDQTIDDMKITYGLQSCEVETLRYSPKTTFLSWLDSKVSGNQGHAKTEYDQLMELMEENSWFTITYMSQVKK